MWQSKREISQECNDIIGSAKGSQISEKNWGEVGKGKCLPCKEEEGAYIFLMKQVHVFWTIKITDRCQQLIWSHAEQTIHTNLLLYCSKKFYTFNQVPNNESEQRHFTHLIRCQTMKVKTEAIHNIKQVKKSC
jgi:hypothetical protein